MKKIALAAAISLTASSAFAGALTDPVVEPDVIIEEASSSSSQEILIPIMLLVFMTTALTSG